jgi:hypothetical protein
MIKFFLGFVIFFSVPTTSYASSINDDRGFQSVISKYVSRENAQRDMNEAIKVVREVREELRLAKLKRKIRR